MITLGLIFAHAWGTNKSFQPTVLYLGTIMLDSQIFEWILK